MLYLPLQYVKDALHRFGTLFERYPHPDPLVQEQLHQAHTAFTNQVMIAEQAAEEAQKRAEPQRPEVKS